MESGPLELWKNNKSLDIMDQQNWIKVEEEENEEEEEEVKIRLTKYGFFLDLFAFSSFSSVFGIVLSFLIIVGGLAMIVVVQNRVSETFYYDEVVICMLMPNIIFNIIYLVIWTLLKMKTNNRNINAIRRISKVYCYVTAFLEIKGMIIMILYGIMILISSEYFTGIVMIIVAPFGLFFAFMKIYDMMVNESKWIGIYLGSRYALFITCLVSFIIITIVIVDSDFVSGSLLVSSMVFPYLIIDICLTIILQSIIADKEKGCTNIC